MLGYKIRVRKAVFQARNLIRMDPKGSKGEAERQCRTKVKFHPGGFKERGDDILVHSQRLRGNTRMHLQLGD